jgi:hypothetical protein
MYRDGVPCDTTLHPPVRLLAQARTFRDPLLIVAFEDFLRRHRGLSDPGKPSHNRQP